MLFRSWCVKELSDNRDGVGPLLDLVVQHVKTPSVKEDEPFAMLVTLLDSDDYVGRCLIGKVESGSIKINDTVKSINLEGNVVENGRLTKLLGFEGTKKIVKESISAGDLVCLAGLKETSVADTICDQEINLPLSSTPIDPPTMSVTITVNDSPFGGTEGDKVTSTVIRERLMAEAETNVAITFEENTDKDSFVISGRGELQIGVLIETMRREGFELTVSRPKVLFKNDVDGNKLEPIEEVTIDVDEEFSSKVIDSMNQRKAEMKDMKDVGAGKKRLIFHAPSRGLIGFQSRFLTITRGTGVLNKVFLEYAPYKGDLIGRRNGALVSMETGSAVAFALFNLQERGEMFIEPQTKVYSGMIVGEHSRDNDLEINVLKGKKLTNVRASGSDTAVILTPPRKMSLEQMMSYINDDENLEVTPKNLRLRKKYLDPHVRKKMLKNSEEAKI